MANEKKNDNFDIIRMIIWFLSLMYTIFGYKHARSVIHRSKTQSRFRKNSSSSSGEEDAFIFPSKVD
jgi:hypothetical protein